MNIETVKNKIKKLLALSSSPNASEASLAMEKCTELMEKYNIRHIDVDEETGHVDISITTVKGYTEKHKEWESKLGAGIADCFDAVALITHKNNEWELSFVASKTDAEFVMFLYLQLRRTISKLGKEYIKGKEGTTEHLLHSYRIGMILTIYTRLFTLYKNVTSEKALVVYKQDAIKQAIEDMFGAVKDNDGESITDRQACEDGERDGWDVALNRPIASAHKSKALK